MSEILLPALPYAADALAPAISPRTVEFHYGKHHAGYVKTLNTLIPGTPYENLALPEIVRLAARNGDTAVFNQAAQSWNHAFYWESLAPAGAGGAPEGPLADAVDRDFGGLALLLDALKTAAVKRFGSGWAWLVRNADGRLSVESTANADTPLTRDGVTPLLVVPVAIGTCILLFALWCRFVRRERMSWAGWTAVALDLAGIALLSCG